MTDNHWWFLIFLIFLVVLGFKVVAWLLIFGVIYWIIKVVDK